MLPDKVRRESRRFNPFAVLDNRWVTRMSTILTFAGAVGVVWKVVKHQFHGADVLTLVSIGLLAIGILLRIPAVVGHRRHRQLDRDGSTPSSSSEAQDDALEIGDVGSRAVLVAPDPPPRADSPAAGDLPLDDWLAQQHERGTLIRDQLDPPKGYVVAPAAQFGGVFLAALEKHVRVWATTIRHRLRNEAPQHVPAFDEGPDLPHPHVLAGVVGNVERDDLIAFVDAKLAALDKIRGVRPAPVLPTASPKSSPRDPVEALRAKRRAAEPVRDWLAVLDYPDGKLPLDEDRVYSWAIGVFRLLRLSFVEHADRFMGTTLTELGHRHFATAYYEQIHELGRQRYLQDHVTLVDEILRSAASTQ